MEYSGKVIDDKKLIIGTDTQINYEPQKLRAYWTTDCQGKKDYDTEIISFSCRIYPPRYNNDSLYSGSAHLYLRNGNGEGFFEDINNETREYREGDYFELASNDFESDSESGLKAQIENWCDEKYNVLIKGLTNLLRMPDSLHCYAKIKWE